MITVEKETLELGVNKGAKGVGSTIFFFPYEPLLYKRSNGNKERGSESMDKNNVTYVELFTGSLGLNPRRW